MAAWTRGDYGRSEGLLDEALAIARELRHSWLEGQVLLNQLALGRLSASYGRAAAVYSHLEQLCQAIDDRWTVAAAQVEAAALFVQLGAWPRVRSVVEQAADPGSLYLVCYTVMEVAGEPWAEQMLVRGCRLLQEHANLIPDPELQRSFCDEISLHRELLVLCSKLET
jgi:hypothetical protein